MMMFDEIINDHTSGSLAIASFCVRHEKPLYVVADTRKIASRQWLGESATASLLGEKAQDPEENMSRLTRNITPLNFCFETIPVTLVTRFFTGQGAVSPDEVAGLSAFSQMGMD
ncbi:MAG: hypothetical protein JW861_08940 [Bacteroidales bacterium]|nr:hypothetical protein [Bacteroidales bacterium]